jgi:cell division protease FtsH
MYKNILIWLVLGFLLTSLFGQFDLGTTKNNVTYSEFIQSVKQGDVSRVTIAGNNITGIGAGGIEFSTYSPGDLGLMGDLLDNGVVVEAKPPEKEGFFKQLIISLSSNSIVNWCHSLHNERCFWSDGWKKSIKFRKIKSKTYH